MFTPITNPNIKALEYPFSFIINQEYDIQYFCKGILSEDKEDPGDFPNNIIEYYWIHEGENDEEPWICLCKLDNGVYAFYSASCDYTGFDCQGGMELVISKNLDKLFNEGMTENDRCIWMKDNYLS
jgi:hypothetical protein